MLLFIWGNYYIWGLYSKFQEVSQSYLLDGKAISYQYISDESNKEVNF